MRRPHVSEGCNLVPDFGVWQRTLSEPVQYDAAWKLTLEQFLPDFLTLAFPDIAGAIDWSVPFCFLDTELQEIVPDSESGLLRVDKLVELQRLDGVPEVLLIHAEIQAQRDDDLPERMFRYFCRIMDRFRRFPISVAVLADPVPHWKPSRFSSSELGCGVEFRFPACKLRDLDLEPWLARGNPVARVIEAHRLAQATGGKPEERRRGKFRLVRNLLTSGMPEGEIRQVLRLMHWLLALPPVEEIRFRQDLGRLQEEMGMPNLSTYDRLVWEEGQVEGLAKGRVSGLQEALMDLSELRFGSTALRLRERIEGIQDQAELRRLTRGILSAASLDEFTEQLPPLHPSSTDHLPRI